MTDNSNGSAPRNHDSQPTHAAFRLALLHFAVDFVHSTAIDELVAGVDSQLAAARVADLRAVLFPQVIED